MSSGLQESGHRTWPLGGMALVVTSLLVASCGNGSGQVARRGPLSGASRASLCSAEQAFGAGLRQRADGTTDAMGLAVDLKLAHDEVVDAGRLGPSSTRAGLGRLADALGAATVQAVTEGMGTELDPLLAQVRADMATFRLGCLR